MAMLICRKITKGKAIEFTLKGVDIMEDDPECARVLYANLIGDEGVSVLKEIHEGLKSLFNKHCKFTFFFNYCSQ